MGDLLHVLGRLLREPDAAVGWRHEQLVTGRMFCTSVGHWRDQFQQHGGQRFALYMHDSLACASALWGAWCAGKTVVLPADALPATCARLHGEVDGFVGDFAGVDRLVTCDVHVGQSEDVQWELSAFGLPADHVGLVVYTSGSTGAPQAIAKRLGQLAAEVATLERTFGDRMRDAQVIATVSHQHIYGLLFKVLWPLRMGRSLRADQVIFPEALAAACAERPCVLISSPAHLKRMLASSFGALVSALPVRAVFSSGGPLAADVAHAWRALLGHAPIEVFGSSETGGVAWREQCDPMHDAGWMPLAYVEWQIDADADHTVKIRSPHTWNGDWITISDRIVPHAEGTFSLGGRTDRIVKIEEKRVALAAIERALSETPWVEDVRVVVQETNNRQQIGAVVVLNAAGKAYLAEQGKIAMNRGLRDVLALHVERIALPRAWRYVDVLPTDTQGKTTHDALLRVMDGVKPMQEARGGMPDGAHAVKSVLPHMQEGVCDAHNVILHLRAPADLLYFDGHFPDAPILPGVVQVDWAIHYGRRYFDLPARFVGLHGLKFQKMITPETPFDMHLTFDVAKSQLTFRMTSAAGQHAIGRVLFGADDV